MLIGQPNFEKELVAGSTSTEETKAIDSCMIEYVSAVTGGCQEDDRAGGDAECEVREEGISKSDQSDGQKRVSRHSARDQSYFIGFVRDVSNSNLLDDGEPLHVDVREGVLRYHQGASAVGKFEANRDIICAFITRNLIFMSGVNRNQHRRVVVRHVDKP